MNKVFCISAFLMVLSVQMVSSQETDSDLKLTAKDSIIARSWHVGLGFNAVDDSGDMFDKLFSVNSQWNMVPYPSRINIGRYFKSGLGVEAIGTFNKYRVGKLIDGEINLEETNYYAIDSRLTYDLMRIFGRDFWFDPYVGGGLGYTSANNEPKGTYNAVVGFRTWITESFGLDFSSSGKWRMGNAGTNHLQHAAGVVYRFGIEKELNKKGEEKLAQMLALEEERQRKQDSINRALQAEREALALAEKLAKEKALAEKEAAEKARQDAIDRKRQMIADEIESLGRVHFDLNSSGLNNNARSVLRGLASIMEKYPELELEISSHADSRGAAKYNEWLSQKRVDRTLGFLRGLGVPSERVKGTAFGESRLLNECDDHTHCPEEKHRVNRRSEFNILKF